MVKEEKMFVKVLSIVKTGSSCVLQLENGNIVRTSSVQKWMKNCSDDWMIETKNSIYRGYGIKEMD